MEVRRHDLVMADWGEEVVSSIPHQGLRELVSQGRIPGIVRRDEAHPLATGAPYYTEHDIVPVGFVYPYREDGMRIRHPSRIRGDAILRITSPYEIPTFEYGRRTAPLDALSQLSETAPLGVWGSAAMEIVTGLPYTDALSDLDLLVKGCSHQELTQLFYDVTAAETSFGIRIDVEITLTSGYGVNLKEYLSSVPEVLGKGVADVILINREDIETLL